MTPMKSPDELETEEETVSGKTHHYRATLQPNEHTECEMCTQETTVGNWFVWDVDALDPPYIDPAQPDQTLIIICSDCQRDEMTGVNVAPEDELNQSGWEWLQELYEKKGATVNIHSGTGAPKSVSKFPPKCNEPHWSQIAGPNGDYGYLRLASERGGKYIDTQADYLLGFSNGWADIKEPTVDLWTPGDRPNTIPVFGDQDLSKWPPSAFIHWPDMGPPPANVLDYAKWAHAEWKAGKNIQFGCFGAHGRTGTFLGLLLILADMARTGEEAKLMVRTLHCKDAIESISQEKALVEFADEVWAPVKTDE